MTMNDDQLFYPAHNLMSSEHNDEYSIWRYRNGIYKEDSFSLKSMILSL